MDKSRKTIIVVAGEPWTVEAVEKTSFKALDGGKALGECDTMRKSLRIAVGNRSKPVSERIIRKRVVHEVYHAVASLAEEQAADMMADVVEDNDIACIARDLLGKE